jgi:hypothetical protein
VNCSLTEWEEAPYDHGVCDKCFTTSGAREVWDRLYLAKQALEDEVAKKLEEFSRNPFDPNQKETK